MTILISPVIYHRDYGQFFFFFDVSKWSEPSWHRPLGQVANNWSNSPTSLLCMPQLLSTFHLKSLFWLPIHMSLRIRNVLYFGASGDKNPWPNYKIIVAKPVQTWRIELPKQTQKVQFSLPRGKYFSQKIKECVGKMLKVNLHMKVIKH